jgi:hypothetical protein
LLAAGLVVLMGLELVTLMFSGLMILVALELLVLMALGWTAAELMVCWMHLAAAVPGFHCFLAQRI